MDLNEATDVAMAITQHLRKPFNEMITDMPEALDLTVLVTGKDMKGALIMSTNQDFQTLPKVIEELQKNVTPSTKVITGEMRL